MQRQDFLSNQWLKSALFYHLLHVKGSYTKKYQRSLDQKGSFTRQMFKWFNSLDTNSSSFTCQRFFYRKLSKKSWSKRFFYSSNVLLQKVMEEILIKKVLLIKGSFTENHIKNLCVKGSFTECYQRNLAQKVSFILQMFFYRKLLK